MSASLRHRETADSRRGGDFSAQQQLQSGCSARHRRDSSLLWWCRTRVATLRSHVNAFSTATVTFCMSLLLCTDFKASLVTSRVACRGWRLYFGGSRVTVSSPPLGITHHSFSFHHWGFFFVFVFLGNREQVEGLEKLKYSPRHCVLERWQQR